MYSAPRTLQLTIQPMIAAIAAGNTMLVKSGSEDCSPEFAKLCEQLFPKYLDNGTWYWKHIPGTIWPA